ncbi:hypothetical protein J7L48_04560 [bacterium]|nr:hypothetical protein [bacterium]
MKKYNWKNIFYDFIRYSLLAAFLSATLYRLLNFDNSVEEFAELNSFKYFFVVLTIVLELFASFSLLFKKYEKISLSLLGLLILYGVIVKVMHNFTALKENFTAMYSVASDIHNLFYHYLLIILLIFIVVYKKKRN